MQNQNRATTRKVTLTAAARVDITRSLRHLAASIEAEATRLDMRGQAAARMAARVSDLRRSALAIEAADAVTLEGRI